MGTKSLLSDDATPTVTWWLVGSSIAVVLVSGLFLPILASLASPSRPAERGDRSLPADDGGEGARVTTATRVALVEAVQSSLSDATWQDVEHRDALCDALIHNTRAALAAGAFAREDRRWYAWLPDSDVRAGVAYHALQGGDGAPRTYVRLRTLLHDRRWSDVAQRGPLCHALVSAEAELPLLW
jgi:hypothetical protein